MLYKSLLVETKNLLLSVFSLIFPNKCLFCANVIEEDVEVCPTCKQLYPIAHINEEEFFAPLLPYTEDVCVLAHYVYVSKAIQLFKFHRQVSKGLKMAKLFSVHIQQCEWIKDLDFIIAVPLHKKAQKRRQFNQCQIFAEIIYEDLKKTNHKLQLNNDNLYRISDNKPQHTLYAHERYENVKDNFALKSVQLFENKKVLLIDDVVTTCSTLKACCLALRKANNITIYIGVFASSRINM